MKNCEYISSIILLLLSIASITEASRLPFGSLSAPHSGFFPLVLAILLGIISLVLLVNTILKKNRKEESSLTLVSGSLKRIGLVIGALFIFAFFFERLGYIISTFFLIAFLLRVIEPQKWWVVILEALLGSLLSYFIFGVLLNTSLPVGILKI